MASPITRSPEEIIEKQQEIAEKLGVPKTKAQIFQLRIMNGEFDIKDKKKQKGRGDKDIFEIEMPKL